jgi:hypothetical protein
VPSRIPLVINSLELDRRSLGEVDFYQEAADVGAENAMSRASNALTQAWHTGELVTWLLRRVEGGDNAAPQQALAVLAPQTGPTRPLSCRNRRRRRAHAGSGSLRAGLSAGVPRRDGARTTSVGI